MKVLYVGHYKPGCTTRMRGEYLQELIIPSVFDVVDIDNAMETTHPYFKSLGWRFKVGPLMTAINKQLKDKINSKINYDLVWVDKGVFIDPALLAKAKRKDNILVHFTPDTAFFHNRSKMFFQAVPLYDYCITTKSFEKKLYENYGVNNLLYCTQGYDPKLHRQYNEFSDKHGIVFVGKHEPWREKVISILLDENLDVKLAGADWQKFAKKNKKCSNLKYLGDSIFGEAYGKLISGSLIGLGLLAKKFPEKHTTRTFEIPACGTVLATERNEEIESFYDRDDVIYFSDFTEMTEKIKEAESNPKVLAGLGSRGYQKVISGGYDYKTILRKLLNQMGIRT